MLISSLLALIATRRNGFLVQAEASHPRTLRANDIDGATSPGHQNAARDGCKPVLGDANESCDTSCAALGHVCVLAGPCWPAQMRLTLAGREAGGSVRGGLSFNRPPSVRLFCRLGVDVREEEEEDVRGSTTPDGSATNSCLARFFIHAQAACSASGAWC